MLISFSSKKSPNDSESDSDTNYVIVKKEVAEDALESEFPTLENYAEFEIANPYTVRKNFLWSYFERRKTDDGMFWAKCKHCSKIIRMGKKATTSSVKYHLSSKHTDLFAEYVKWETIEKMKRSGDEAFKVANEKILDELNSLHGQSAKKRKLATSHSPQEQDTRQQKFDISIIKLLVRCDLPFTLVNKDGFKEFIDENGLKCTLKAADIFNRSKLPLLYNNVKEVMNSKFKTDLMTCNTVGLTADLWKNDSSDSYLSLTMNYIDKNFEAKHFIIAFEELKAKFTCADIASKLDSIIRSIPSIDKVSQKICIHNIDLKGAITNYTTELSGNLICIDHLVNAMMLKAMKSLSPLENASEKVIELYTKTNQSYAVRQAIEAECKKLEVKYTKINISSPVRWSSTLPMIQSIMQMRGPLESLRDSYDGNMDDLALSIPSHDEFEALENIMDVLENSNKLTDSLVLDGEAAIHLAIVHLYNFRSYVVSSIQWAETNNKTFLISFLEALKNEIDSYFPECGTRNWYYKVGNLLHPRFKGAILQKFSVKTSTVDRLVEMHPATKEFIEKQKQISKDKSLMEMDSDLDPADELLIETNAATIESFKPPLYVEIQTYYDMPPAEKNMSVLNWWKENQSQLPLLAQLAIQYLAIPLTSVSNEKLFSKCENIVRDAKQNLPTANISMIPIIQQNLSLIDWSKMWLNIGEQQTSESQEDIQAGPSGSYHNNQ